MFLLSRGFSFKKLMRSRKKVVKLAWPNPFPLPFKSWLIFLESHSPDKKIWNKLPPIWNLSQELTSLPRKMYLKLKIKSQLSKRNGFQMYILETPTPFFYLSAKVTIENIWGELSVLGQKYVKQKKISVARFFWSRWRNFLFIFFIKSIRHLDVFAACLLFSK